jgi:outer membrane lipoprotein carrier protein
MPGLRQSFVGPFRLLIGLLAVCAFATEAPLDGLLKRVESRYNHAKTLQVLFTEEYTPPGHSRRTESGLLMLRKPRRMRWDYSQPQGKLFVSDGKLLWLYTPSENRVEKMKFQETDDMRAPLAFLLGKLNFDKDFRNLQAHADGADTRITAEPRGDNLPYTAVEFVVAPDSRIREVKVTGYDKSVLHFTFDKERLDPRLDDKLFQFEVPKGAELVESAQ